VQLVDEPVEFRQRRVSSLSAPRRERRGVAVEQRDDRFIASFALAASAGVTACMLCTTCTASRIRRTG
jgi:hypothetical protein